MPLTAGFDCRDPERWLSLYGPYPDKAIHVFDIVIRMSSMLMITNSLVRA